MLSTGVDMGPPATGPGRTCIAMTEPDSKVKACAPCPSKRITRCLCVAHVISSDPNLAIWGEPLFRGPPAIDDLRCSSDASAGPRAQEQCVCRDLGRVEEALDRRRGQHDLFDHLILGHPAYACLVGHLPLHQGGADVGGADGVYRYPFGARLQRGRFRQTEQTMLRRDVGGLEWGRDETMNRGDVDNPAPPASIHAGKSVFHENERA